MRSVTALVDGVQAGDMGEIGPRPIVLTPGTRLVTHLWLRFENEMPNTVDTKCRRFITQKRKSQPEHTEFCGEVVGSACQYRKATEYFPRGLTHLEVLAVAGDIPVSLNFFWPDRIKVTVPRVGVRIRGGGPLMTEPSFSTHSLFSPVCAEIEDVTKYVESYSRNRGGDIWGHMRLRLISELSNPDNYVSNLGPGAKKRGKFVRISEYNPARDWDPYD